MASLLFLPILRQHTVQSSAIDPGEWAPGKWQGEKVEGIGQVGRNEGNHGEWVQWGQGMNLTTRNAYALVHGRRLDGLDHLEPHLNIANS